jgi:hypothetical protein
MPLEQRVWFQGKVGDFHILTNPERQEVTLSGSFYDVERGIFDSPGAGAHTLVDISLPIITKAD